MSNRGRRDRRARSAARIPGQRVPGHGGIRVRDMASGLDTIRSMMEENGIFGSNPRNYVILSHFGYIQDGDTRFDVKVSTPRPVPAGHVLWVTETSDSPALMRVRVVRDYHPHEDSLWVEKPDGSVQFKVPLDDAHPTPIPLRPTLVHKKTLARYLGRDQAREMFWRNGRRVHDPARYKAPMKVEVSMDQPPAEEGKPN